MRRRDLGAVGVLGVVVTLVTALSVTNFRGQPLASWSSPYPSASTGPVEMLLGWILLAVGGLVALGVVVLLAHQYVRWKEYRPAIHLALLLIVFISGLAVVLGPVGIGSSAEPMSGNETTVIRVAGAGLLFFLGLFVARLFDQENGEGH